MKKVLIVLTIVAFASCSSNDAAGDANSNKFEKIQTILPQSEWKVAVLIDGQSDHTADFEGFVFTFNEDGTVVIKTELITEDGTWAYNNSSSSEEILMEISETSPFDEINHNWDIVSVSNSKIELSELTSGNGDVKLFTLAKL
ncbi:MAG: hypothetical protein KDC78_10400 [Aequorivita sp.]|nr:hypothetical protein [Aequorivita sp.]